MSCLLVLGGIIGAIIVGLFALVVGLLIYAEGDRIDYDRTVEEP